MRRLTFLLLSTFLACEKDGLPDDCDAYFAGERYGYAYADGNHEDLVGDLANFGRVGTENASSGEISHGDITDVSVTVYTAACVQKQVLGIWVAEPNFKDTLFFASDSSTSKNILTSTGLFITDDDAIIEIYDPLVTDDPKGNWLLFESVNADTTLISGQFQLSFITTYDHYLTGERQRWDDPDRPNVLHFTNGRFQAYWDP